MTADALAIWLYDIRTAVVEKERGRLRLSYTNEALNGYPLGTPLLSLSLPLTSQRFSQGLVRSFLDGLLPEGDARKTIAADFNLRASDTYGLIRALGRECAGALVIQPDDEPAPRKATTLTAEPLTEEKIADLVANLRSAPLGVGGRVRMSLAGAQEKLILTHMSDGTWGRPVDGTPSTHILKPEIATFPNIVQNEAFCMRFARALGLPVAHVDTTAVSSRRVIVVERYDRVVSADASVQRVHQEDFCQAMGIVPDKKYEEDGGPSLRRIAALLEAAAAPNSLELLLRATTMNVLVGNGDAHGKNFSLLHDPSGVLRLAPLYDIVSTLVYGDDRLAMYIDNVHRTNRVTTERLVNEAAHWGLSRRIASDIITDVLDRIPNAVQAARDETEDLPPDVPAIVDSQLAQLQRSFRKSATGSSI